jgi:diacylglycerol kinase (ATP)
MSAIKYLVVFNPLPNSRRTRRLTQLVEKLKSLGLEYTLYPTAPTISANRIYFTKHHAEFSDVIVVGGDGTFNLMVNVLIDYAFNVALLPAGTGNDFARAWYGEKRNDLPYLLEVVTSDATQDIYLGYCQFNANGIKELPAQLGKDPVAAVVENVSERIYFHNVLGIGFDAAIAKALRHNKGKVPTLSYLIAALWYIPLYKEPQCLIRGVNNDTSYFNFMTVFANSRYFGSGLPVAPAADPVYRQLDMVKLEKQSMWTKFALLSKLLFGKHAADKSVDMAAYTQPLRVETVGLDVEADGEYLGQSPCVVGSSEQVLRLKVGRAN